ncbi:hypothetical protein FB570_101157 [Streptomyces sp. T12]|nr:hypothetical protein FB570_101157 [Streptomyces sp. T12]
MPEFAARRVAGGAGKRAGGLLPADTRVQARAAVLPASGAPTGNRADGPLPSGTRKGGRHP